MAAQILAALAQQCAPQVMTAPRQVVSHSRADSIFLQHSAKYGQSATITNLDVARALVARFGGRITDLTRPIDAAYGAVNSYHKIGRAVDFVPAGGVHTITKQDIRAALSFLPITIIELLGPGEPGHSNHFHIAFARVADGLGLPQYAAHTVTENEQTEQTVTDPEPASWDVFARQRWMNRQTQMSDGAAGSRGTLRP